jgi:fructose-bisphosphate aldolase, class I
MFNKKEQLNVILNLCSSEKGILAADESIGTIGNRFKNIELENNLMNRTKYRELLFTTPNLNKYISGVITFEETLLQENNQGELLIQSLLDNDILVGIKVDKGVKNIYNTNGETTTQGLDDLDHRCKLYYSKGARFAKWRSVIKINSDLNHPSDLAIEQNLQGLARYASICQNNGLVPIVEPEIIMDGTHSIDKTYDVTLKVLNRLYFELLKFRVDLECTILKPSMVRSGSDNKNDINYRDIADLTVKALKNTVPSCVKGIFFLSGGMSESESTIALNEINRVKNNKPWYLSFSYGRALQGSVLQKWKGRDENIIEAQNKLLELSKNNGNAAIGRYHIY